MNKEDKIKELFAEKLGAHEAPVNPELWNAIASQLGTAATVTSTGLSIVTKIIIGISAASVIGTGVYFLSGAADSDQQKESVQHSQLTGKNTGEEDNTDFKQLELTTNGSSDQQKRADDGGTVVSEQTIKEDKKTTAYKSSEATTPPVVGKGGEEKSTSRAHEMMPPYRNEPSPNLIGEKPAVMIPETKTPVKTEERQVIRKQEEQVADRPASGLEEQKQATFEITKLPNIYVLNASGYFSIGHKGEYSDFQFTIMDNRNNVVFRSDDPDFEWRGTDLYGNTVEPGNYIYIVTVKDQNGKAINKYSALAVINQ